MTLDPNHAFPQGFLWGVGTNGVQNEGAPLADGGGPSIWHAWSRTPGNVTTGETVEDGPDFYRHYRDDLRLIRGLGSHNFGVSWARVLPEGTGTINHAGLDFYDRLVDETLAGGMSPICGMYTWDHPQALQDRGGWLNRDMAHWYADYAAVLHDRLGDRVTHWLPMCEIVSFTQYAYFLGYYPPMLADVSQGLIAIHHQLLGQGQAVQALRAGDAQGQIGNWHLLIPTAPKSPKERDVAAAARLDAFYNGIVLDPQLLGHYPEVLIDWYGEAWPHTSIRDGDLETISAPIDFIGVDYYGSSRAVQAAKPGEHALSATDTFNENDPDGLHTALIALRDTYGKIPVYLVEIGAARADRLTGGEVHDHDRIGYLRDHLIAAHRAIQDGIDLRGAFVWGLLDGWEFHDGLSLRYGLVHVDHQTKRRTVKASGHWFHTVATTNALPSPGRHNMP